jgi:AcrR family transcriptional regulator
MARPSEHDKRRELAARAVAVLQRKGLEISMTELADALEIKRPTLLYHFPTKAHIIEVALEELLTEQIAYVSERVAQHAHPIDRLYAQVRAVHAFHEGQEARVVFLTQAIATTAGERLSHIIAIGNRVATARREAAGKALRDGIAAGTVARCDVDALLALLRAVTDGLMVQRVMTGVDLKPVHELLWDRVLAPLKLEPKPTPKPTPKPNHKKR